jgi:hypothetical protein
MGQLGISIIDDYISDLTNNTIPNSVSQKRLVRAHNVLAGAILKVFAYIVFLENETE